MTARRSLATAAAGIAFPAMRRFRVVFYILGVLVLLGGISGGAAFWFTSGAVEAAAVFFRAIAERGPDAAYQQDAPLLRDATPAPRFGQIVERLGSGFR